MKKGKIWLMGKNLVINMQKQMLLSDTLYIDKEHLGTLNLLAVKLGHTVKRLETTN